MSRHLGVQHSRKSADANVFWNGSEHRGTHRRRTLRDREIISFWCHPSRCNCPDCNAVLERMSETEIGLQLLSLVGRLYASASRYYVGIRGHGRR